MNRKIENKGFWSSKLAYFLFGLLIIGGHLAVLVATVDDMGLTDDDDFYVPAGIAQADHLERMIRGAFKGDFSQWDRHKIAHSFRVEHRHPGVAKSMMGLTYLVFHRLLGWYDKMDASHLGIAFFAIWISYMLFRMGWEIYGPRAGIFAALAWILLPRTFFHSHVGTLDVAVTATYLGIIYSCWRAERGHWIYIPLTGVMYGVAMATKLNAPFAIAPLMLYWAYRYRQVQVLKTLAPVPVKRIVMMIVSMGILSLPVFFLLWPWIWVDTIDRFWEFVLFHMHHYGILLLYLGDIYNNPFAPWHAPFVYTAVTTPLVVLVLGLAGFFMSFKVLRWSNLKSFPNWISKRQDMSLLFAINAFICIGVVAFPNNPKYGGVKLWQPMFPFLVLLAAWALDICIEHLSDIAKLKGKLKQLVGGALTLLCLLPGFLGLLNNYPDLLTYYNELAGNTQGGAEMGMERQYYDQCYKSYIHFWNEQKQWKNIKISYEPYQREYQRTYPWYKRLDKLRRDVTFVKPDRARFLILTHERRWPRYPSLLQEYRLEKEIYTHKINGVPMYTIYDLKPEEDEEKPAKAAKKRSGKKREVRREDKRVQKPVEKQIKRPAKMIKTP